MWWLFAVSALVLAGPTFEEICADENSTHRCNAAIEEVQLPKWSDRVSRDGGVLSIVLDNGNVARIMDDARFHYRFRDCMARYNKCVFAKGANEYLRYIMIDTRTGNQNTYRDLPLYAPDGARIVVSGASGLFQEGFLEVRNAETNDLEYGLTFHELRDLTLRIPDCHDEPSIFAPGVERADWIDSGTIHLELTCRDEGMKKFATPMVLKRENRSWVLTEGQ